MANAEIGWRNKEVASVSYEEKEYHWKNKCSSKRAYEMPLQHNEQILSRERPRLPPKTHIWHSREPRDALVSAKVRQAARLHSKRRYQYLPPILYNMLRHFLTRPNVIRLSRMQALRRCTIKTDELSQTKRKAPSKNKK